MLLPDSYLYSTEPSKNNIISQLNQVLSASAEQQPAQHAAFTFLLEQQLQQNKQEALAIALSLAPSQKAYRYLWQTIKSLISAAPTHIFAIPIILVAGSKQPLVLRHRLQNIDALLTLLKENKSVAPQADVLLDAALYPTESLTQIHLPQLYRWQRVLQYASGGLPISLPANPIQLTQSDVFVRYLIGLTVNSPLHTHESTDLIVKTAQLVQSELAQTGLTLFTIPRAPQLLLDALETGRSVYREIAMQVFISDTLKKYRSTRKTPTACVACHRNHEIKLVISTFEAPEIWESFIWPLHPLDSPAIIGQQIETLLKECQVEQVLLLNTLQPATIEDKTLFITPAQACAQSTIH